MQQERIYSIAIELTQSKRAVDIKRALDLFESIPDYKDASSCAQACKKRLEILEEYDVYRQRKTSPKPIGTIVCLAICVLVLCIAVGNIVAYLFDGEQNAKVPYSPVQTSIPTAVPTKKVVVTSSPRPTPTKVSVATPVPMPTTPSILPADVAIGDVVQFGSYEQDNVLSNGYEAIDWVVLDKQDGKALLLSRYCLCDANGWSFVTWESSEQRTWLNDDFYNMSFSPAQQQNICTTTIHTSDNSNTGTPGGNDTEDKIFILSVEEVEQYLLSDTGSNSLSKYTSAGYYKEESDAYLPYDGSPCWILRTPGDRSGYPVTVDFYGFINTYLIANVRTMRPAMWVALDSGKS